MAPEKIVIPGQERVGANILFNSDFEIETDGDAMPDGWSAEGEYLPEAYTLDRSGVALDFSRAHSGKSSVRLTKTPATKRTVALRQRFDVTPGTWYRASVRYQAAVKQGGFHIIFTAFDQDGRWLRHQDGARGVNSTADKWRELSVDTQVKEDTAELMIECLLYDDQAEGVAWVDDFTCAPLEKN